MLLTIMLASAAMPRQPDVAIVGGTIVDVAHRTGRHRGRDHRVILIRDDRIRAILPERVAKSARGTIVIDADGRYVVPGLIDGFGAMCHQALAAAYLYDGVTTVVVPLGPADGGKGEEHVVSPAADPDVVEAIPVSAYRGKRGPRQNS